jgi:hypothetical protein
MDEVIWDTTKLCGHISHEFRMAIQVNLCGLILTYIPEIKKPGTYSIFYFLCLPGLISAVSLRTRQVFSSTVSVLVVISYIS